MNTKLAKIYAKALFDAAVAAGDLNAVLDDLQLVVSIGASSEELRHFLNLPQIPTNAKKNAIHRIFEKINKYTIKGQRRQIELVQNFVILLIDKARQYLLPQILTEFNNLVDEYKGILEVYVTTAIPLSTPIERRLTKKLEKLTSKRIVLHKKVNSNILGGVILRIKDLQIDGSIASGLRQLRDKIVVSDA
ncbi:MAG: ATP synthase F1 subunit delta [Candidatus Cloacimonetes bacterium 4572_55]|nr:MAG: ATP synthase F1 subunit delta [Candidatus Cloacimonetes bacterium 4572_55]